MSYRRTLALVFSSFVTASFATFSAPVAADDGSRFDIVGIRLGMTPEQVVQALKVHGIEGSAIHESRMAFSYSDGVNHGFKTEDFVARVTAGKVDQVGSKRRNDSFELFFSPPPAGGRLVGARRLLDNSVDPITAGQFRQAVRDKYGEPAATMSGHLNWKFGGGDMNCLTSNPAGTGVELPWTDPRKRKSILDQVYMKSGSNYQLGVFRVRKVKNLGQCASMLEYRIAGADNRPATSVTAVMVDVQSWVKAELAANAHVDKLRQEAVEKRVGKGGKPSL